MSKIDILVVDDHPIFLSGIKTLIESNKGMNVCGEATNGEEAIIQCRVLNPDMIIMDINMPSMNGIEATKQILSESPEVKVVALSINSGEMYVQEMLNAGAEGYLLKEEAPEELIKAIQKISNGDIYLSSGITRAALSSSKRRSVSAINVLKTKLLRPNVYDFLVRKRITDELEKNIFKPLSLVSAGAGYGKSVAVSQWLEETDYPHAWISLDEEQNDLRVFLAYLVTAIDGVLPGSMKETSSSISGTELPSAKDLRYILMGELSEIEDEMILVLDDYHKINDEKIHGILNEWLRFPPPNIHLTIITRRDPPININTLKLGGRMTEVRMDKLSFNKDEIQQLFKKTLDVDLSDRAINMLQDKTEGWIIALSLATLVFRNADDLDEVIRNLEGSLSTISDYLVYEVLSLQSEEMQESLVLSSILDRFCDEILDDLYLKEKELSGKEMIKNLIKSNMFIIGLDTKDQWFRYHHLFQELLQNQLGNKFAKEKINELHLQASKWFENHGFLEEAMDYALKISDFDRAAEIIKSHRLQLLNSNQYTLLSYLQHKLPIHLIESDPELALIECYIEWNQGNFVRLGELEEKIKQNLEVLKNDPIQLSELNFFFGFVSLFIRGDLASALQHFEVGLNTVPESLPEPRGILETHQFIFGQLGGQYIDLKEWYYELLSKDLDPVRKNHVFQGFLAAALDQADMKEVEKNSFIAISTGRETQMYNSLGIVLYMVGCMQVRTGRWDQAIETFREIISLKYHMHSRVVIDSLMGLIICHKMKGKLNVAEEELKTLEKYVEGLDDFHNSFLWSVKMRYNLILNNKDVIKELLKDRPPGVLDLVMWLDVPEITHANGFLFEGSDEGVEKAEKALVELEGITTAMSNWLHLTDVLVLKALLYFRKGEKSKAKDALIKSLEIAEPQGIVSFYIELGKSFKEMITGLEGEIEHSPFIEDVLEQIDKQVQGEIEKPAVKEKKEKLNALTAREMDVLQCVAEGLRNQEIADKLFNSEETIKKHIYNMFQKMNVKNRMSLVTRAKEEGILE